MAYTKILVTPEAKEEYKKRVSERSKLNWANPEFRAKQSESRKKSWTPERRAIAAERFRKFNTTDKARASRSVSSKKNWKDEDIRAQMVSGMMVSRAEHFRRSGPNAFESRCYSFLDSIGAEYLPQHPIGELCTVVDAYIPKSRMCIYFDSEYWHSMPDNIQRDKRIRSGLIERGYLVAVIRCDRWARVINQGDLDAIRESLCA